MRKLVLNAGFTIVELLAALAIISVLVGLLLAGALKAPVSAKKNKAKATIEQLEMALEMYSQNWGTYPDDDGSYPFTGCSNLIAALESYTSEARRKGGPYVTYAAELKSGGSLLDPWGKPYRYHWNTTSTNVQAVGQVSGQPNITYNIWSCGPDGNNNSGSAGSDDIVNW